MEVGDIYYCKRLTHDKSSGHFWILLYISKREIKYITATSRTERFTYVKNLFGTTEKPHQHPATAVFLEREDVADKNKTPLFEKETMLNCYFAPEEIARSEFENRRMQGILKHKRCKLPNKYLAKIIPSTRAREGRWSKKDIQEVLHEQNGIAKYILQFYTNLLKK